MINRQEVNRIVGKAKNIYGTFYLLQFKPYMNKKAQWFKKQALKTLWEHINIFDKTYAQKKSTFLLDQYRPFIKNLVESLEKLKRTKNFKSLLPNFPQKIVGKARFKGIIHYLFTWKSPSQGQPIWLPSQKCGQFRQLIRKFTEQTKGIKMPFVYQGYEKCYNDQFKKTQGQFLVEQEKEVVYVDAQNEQNKPYGYCQKNQNQNPGLKQNTLPGHGLERSNFQSKVQKVMEQIRQSEAGQNDQDSFLQSDSQFCSSDSQIDSLGQIQQKQDQHRLRQNLWKQRISEKHSFNRNQDHIVRKQLMANQRKKILDKITKKNQIVIDDDTVEFKHSKFIADHNIQKYLAQQSEQKDNQYFQVSLVDQVLENGQLIQHIDYPKDKEKNSINTEISSSSSKKTTNKPQYPFDIKTDYIFKNKLDSDPYKEYDKKQKQAQLTPKRDNQSKNKLQLNKEKEIFKKYQQRKPFITQTKSRRHQDFHETNNIPASTKDTSKKLLDNPPQNKPKPSEIIAVEGNQKFQISLQCQDVQSTSSPNIKQNLYRVTIVQPESKQTKFLLTSQLTQSYPSQFVKYLQDQVKELSRTLVHNQL